MGQFIHSRQSSEPAAKQEAFAEVSCESQVKGQAFVDWFQQQRHSFDTGALKEFGWLKMNAFIDDCLHVVPSGKHFPFTEYFKGAVVLETIDFSVSDLRKDDPIQHGLLQVTVSLLHCKQFAKSCPNKKWNNLQIRSGTCLENECFLNLWVGDFEARANYSRTKKTK